MRLVLTLFLVYAALAGSGAGAKLVYYHGKLECAPNRKDWSPLTEVNTHLNDNQFVKLNDKTEAIFTTDAGEVVYLKQMGVVAVKDLAMYKVAGNNQNFAGYYLKFIAGEVTHHEGSVEREYKQNLNNLGGVSRGHAKDDCYIAPASAELIVDSAIVFAWKHFSIVKDYTFMIFSDSLLEKSIVVRDLRDTVTEVRTDNLLPGNTYYWKVESRTRNNCGEGMFRITTASELKTINQQYADFRKTLTFSKAVNLLLEAAFYKEKGLYKKAQQCYKQARSLEPANETILKLASSYLIN